jgi:hypothetical protein
MIILPQLLTKKNLRYIDRSVVTIYFPGTISPVFYPNIDELQNPAYETPRYFICFAELFTNRGCNTIVVALSRFCAAGNRFSE